MSVLRACRDRAERGLEVVATAVGRRWPLFLWLWAQLLALTFWAHWEPRGQVKVWTPVSGAPVANLAMNTLLWPGAEILAFAVQAGGLPTSEEILARQSPALVLTKWCFAASTTYAFWWAVALLLRRAYHRVEPRWRLPDVPRRSA
jgi:hypothetical protein